MKIKKAIITAAGVGQEQIPQQTLIDRRGVPCSTLEVQLAEISESGIEEVGIVIGAEANEQILLQALGNSQLKVKLIRQPSCRRGFGHAILAAEEFIDGTPFLLMVGDHVFVSDRSDITCAAQLLNVAEKEACLVSAVQSTHESQLRLFGAIGGLPESGSHSLYTVNTVREKPTPTLAEQELMVAGQRVAHYLCFFGMHVITNSVINQLKAEFLEEPENPLGLSSALDAVANKERYLAVQLEGRRFDLEQPYGLLKAQIATGLQGRDRDELLTGIIELLAPLKS